MEESNNNVDREIMQTIQQFRTNPKVYLNQSKFIGNQKKKKEYEDFINSLQKMPELILDKNLCKIAEEESKKFSEDSDYNKYQIGEEFKIKIGEEFNIDEVALIAIEEINLEKLIIMIISNEVDTGKKGKVILTNPLYTHIGFSKSEEDSLILIFAKKK